MTQGFADKEEIQGSAICWNNHGLFLVTKKGVILADILEKGCTIGCARCEEAEDTNSSRKTREKRKRFPSSQ
jgi:hypothetical protein